MVKNTTADIIFNSSTIKSNPFPPHSKKQIPRNNSYSASLAADQPTWRCFQKSIGSDGTAKKLRILLSFFTVRPVCFSAKMNKRVARKGGFEEWDEIFIRKKNKKNSQNASKFRGWWISVWNNSWKFLRASNSDVLILLYFGIIASKLTMI